MSKVIDAVSDLSDLFLFITSFKSSSALKAAKNSVEQGLKKLKKRRVKKIAKSSLKAFKSSFFKVYAKKGVNYAQHIIKLMAKEQLKKRLNKSLKNREKKGIKDKIKEKAKEADVDGITNTVVYAVCSEAFAHLKKKKEKQINFKNIISSVDAFKSKKGVKACKKKETQKDEGLLCARRLIIDSPSVDPMGLSTIGSAFMHQTCDIPSKIPEPSYSDKELKKYADNSPWSVVGKEYKKKNRKIKVKRGCIKMFKNENYKGRSKTYCENTKFVGKKDNDQWSSYVIGDKTTAMFYQHSDYKGDTFRTKRRKMPKLSRVGFDNRISSLKVAKWENRIIFFRHSNYEGDSWMFTKGERLSHLGGDQNDRYSSVWVGRNVRVRVRKHKDYRGKHWTIKKDAKNFGRKWNDEISSFKVLAK